MYFVVCIIFLAVLTLASIKYIKKDIEKTNSMNKTFEEQKQKEHNLKLEREEEDRIYEEMYGKLTARFGNYEWTSIVSIYDETGTILFGDKKFSYNDILSYELKDDNYTIRGETISETKKSLGSIVGRAIIGEMLIGTTGAIIGGVTAKEKSVSINKKDIVKHNYYINVTVNDISEPNIRLNFYGFGNIAEKVASVLSIIIKNN